MRAPSVFVALALALALAASEARRSDPAAVRAAALTRMEVRSQRRADTQNHSDAGQHTESPAQFNGSAVGMTTLEIERQHRENNGNWDWVAPESGRAQFDLAMNRTAGLLWAHRGLLLEMYKFGENLVDSLDEAMGLFLWPDEAGKIPGEDTTGTVGPGAMMRFDLAANRTMQMMWARRSLVLDLYEFGDEMLGSLQKAVDLLFQSNPARLVPRDPDTPFPHTRTVGTHDLRERIDGLQDELSDFAANSSAELEAGYVRLDARIDAVEDACKCAPESNWWEETQDKADALTRDSSDASDAKSWKLVRYMPKQSHYWHPTKDKLVGDEAYGTELSQTSTWGTTFSGHSQFLITDVDMGNWIFFSKSVFDKQFRRSQVDTVNCYNSSRVPSAKLGGQCKFGLFANDNRRRYSPVLGVSRYRFQYMNNGYPGWRWGATSAAGGSMVFVR